MNVLEDAYPLRRPIGALASSPQMSDQAPLSEPDEVPACFRRVAFGEIAEPAAQERVDPVYYLLDGHPAEPRAGEVAHLVARALLRLARRLGSPVPRPATFSVAAAQAERVAEEVERGVLVVHPHDPRLLAVDHQPEATLDLLLDEPDDPMVDELRHHDEVVGIPYQPGLCPGRRPGLQEERAVEPVKECVRQQRRDHAPLRGATSRPRRRALPLLDGCPQE